MELQAALLGRLTRVLAGHPGPSLPDRMCAAFGQIIGADGTAMTLGFAPSDRNTVCATDELAAHIENLQDVLRQGPGLDAFRTSRTVSLTGDPAGHERWPLLVEALQERGTVPEVHAFVMCPGRTVLGVITSHVAAGSDLAVAHEEAQYLAHAVGVATLGDVRPGDFADERWAVRDRISQATGMVVAQLHVAPQDALAVLRAHAYAEDATLAEVCRRVVGRALRFGERPGGPA